MLPVSNLTPGSVEWWLDRLGRRLDARQRPMLRYAEYYEGVHPLLFASARFQQAFGDLFRPLSDNFMALVVDAVVERLRVVGFRFGERGSDEAWRIWQANDLDADSSMLFRDTLIKSESAVIVWAGRDDRTPLITPEDPLQVVVERSPANPRVRLAALKRWDDENKTYGTLYLPDAIYKFEAPRRVVAVATTQPSINGPAWDDLNRPTPIPATIQSQQWARREVRDEPWPLPNPLGVVPVVPLVNRPRLDRTGRSELQVAVPLQDALNKIVADALVGSEYAAYRQRWATGIDIPNDPVSGEPVEAFTAAVERLWHTKAPDAKFGDFGETDLGNYAKLIDLFVQHLASATRTPPHYLINTGVLPSGESQTAAESGLVSKVSDRHDDFSDPLEDIVRLAFAVIGETELAAITDGEIIWKDPERRQPSEYADYLSKLGSALHVHDEILQEKAGFSPQEIRRNRTLMTARQLEESIIAAPINVRAEAAGQLVRSGWDADTVAELLGLPGLVHTGHLPVTVQALAGDSAPPVAPPPTNGSRPPQ